MLPWLSLFPTSLCFWGLHVSHPKPIWIFTSGHVPPSPCSASRLVDIKGWNHIQIFISKKIIIKGNKRLFFKGELVGLSNHLLPSVPIDLATRQPFIRVWVFLKVLVCTIQSLHTLSNFITLNVCLRLLLTRTYILSLRRWLIYIDFYQDKFTSRNSSLALILQKSIWNSHQNFLTSSAKC